MQSLLRTIPEGSGWKDEERGEEKAAKVSTEISYRSGGAHMSMPQPLTKMAEALFQEFGFRTIPTYKLISGVRIFDNGRAINF